MKRIAVLLLFSAGLQAQTTISADQLKPGTVVSAVVCLPPGTTGAGCKQVTLDQTFTLDKSVTPYVLRAVPQGGAKYVPGPLGVITVDNAKNPPEIDIVTTMLPRKSVSETISGLWSYSQGLVLSPVALPPCDATTNRGRLLQDAADGVLKYCDGAWQPILAHNHWQFRTSTAILTAPQSTFNILDPTIVPDSLKVHRNGVLQTLGPDYTRGGLGAAAPVIFTAASMPQAGDTVTLDYMW